MRVVLDGLAEQRFCLSVAPLLAVEHTQIVLCFGILRIERECRLQLRFGLRQFAILEIEQAKLVLRQCQLGIELDRFIERYALARAVARLVEGQREIVIGLGVIWIEFQRLLISLNGPGRVPAFEQPVGCRGFDRRDIFLHALLLFRFELLELLVRTLGLVECTQHTCELEARLCRTGVQLQRLLQVRQRFLRLT